MGRAKTASGGSGVLSLRHFGLVLFIPWRVGAEQAGAAKDAIMAYGFGGAVADFGFSWLRGPRLSYLSPLRGREGAAGQAVVCPLLRGSSPTRGVAPKQHRTRRLLTNRPCSSLVHEESDSKERLRVSNWIVQRLYNYAVKKTLEL